MTTIKCGLDDVEQQIMVVDHEAGLHYELVVSCTVGGPDGHAQNQ